MLKIKGGRQLKEEEEEESIKMRFICYIFICGILLLELWTKKFLYKKKMNEESLDLDGT